MKRVALLFVLVILGTRLCAQYRIDDGSELLALQQVSMEKMYVHLSATLVFSGEYLYYKAYCMDARTGRLNPPSTIAYVSLVDASGSVVFRHKLTLEKGMAQGDFFVNTDIPSGTYKLIGYTRWMQNAGLKQFFQQDVVILNPYRSDQTALLPGGGSQAAAADSVQAGTSDYREEAPAAGSSTSEGGLIELQLDKNQYGLRKPATLTVRNYKGRLGHGSYSLLVRKLPELPELKRIAAEGFMTEALDFDQVLPQEIGDSIYLPEQRGELVFGRVLQQETGLPAADTDVIISIPGDDFILKSATTDADGYFFSYLRKPYGPSGMFFQVAGEGAFRIEQGNYRPMPLDSLQMQEYFIHEGQRETIRSRSIHNQLENAYFEVKPDTLVARAESDPFTGGIPEVIELDDYTRFPTFQETLVEILNFVGYRNAPGDRDYIRVAQDLDTYNEPMNQDPALFLIDGVFIPNPQDYKSFNARKIKTIRVLRDPLVLGSKTYQGMVAVETFEGDFPDSYRYGNGLRTDLPLPEPEKNYFRQDHSSGDFDRVPDFRHVLLWVPRLELDSPQRELPLFTSDLPGVYEVVLEGFTTYGKPISLRKQFEVR